VSLAKFRATNHPQQTAVRGATDSVDDRGTDPAFFMELDARFHFTLDVAASEHNAKCSFFYDQEADGLASSWSGERVWCNPPYSNIRPWVAKAWDAWGHEPRISRPTLIVMLLPANRTEQAWWHEFVEPHRDRPRSPLRTEFIRGRLRFVRASSYMIEENQRPPFGCVLLIWDDPFLSALP
jgi:phage N-6-adenine-methyltransferase